MPMTTVQEVEHDLLAGKASRMSARTARNWRLAPWAYYTAAPDSALRRECGADFADAWRRVLRIQSRFAELLAAWNAAGIDVTVFKGFALAHLSYPHPALRHFGDIDAYLPPGEMARALEAMPAGWRVLPNLGAAGPHGPVNLRSPCNELEIDLHRSFFKPNHATSPHHEAATRLLLENRIAIDCGACGIRSLAPVDLALIGLAVNRGYGADRWRPKSHDYLDLLYLHQRQGLSEDAIRSRAEQLGLRRTWRAYARSCNPQFKVLRLARTWRSFAYRAWNDASILAERREMPLIVVRLLHTLAALRDVLIVMPTLLALINRARDTSSAEELLRLDLPMPSRKRKYNLMRGVGRGLQLLRPLTRRQGHSGNLLRSIAAYRLLHWQGLPVVWVCGTSVSEDRAPEEYAWLEIGGFPLAVWSGEAARRIQTERTRIVLPPADPTA
jgi:hypothetical protein